MALLKSQAEAEQTALFGGFKGARDQEQALQWLSGVLQKAEAPRATTSYVKGTDFATFNGIVFAKFTSKAECEDAITKINEKKLQYGGQTIWAKPDKPLEQRVPHSVLFAVKKMLTSKEWGFASKSLWVDKDEQVLNIGKDEKILHVSVVEAKLKIVYGEGWQEYLTTDNEVYANILADAEDKASRGTVATKGIVKGKSK